MARQHGKNRKTREQTKRFTIGLLHEKTIPNFSIYFKMEGVLTNKTMYADCFQNAKNIAFNIDNWHEWPNPEGLQITITDNTNRETHCFKVHKPE
jgi:hypothetical protein